MECARERGRLTKTVQRSSMPRNTNRHKLNPTRPQFIWRVETTAIEIPREFWCYAVPGFTQERRVIWTRQRKIAQQISNADEQAGGHPWPFQYESRKCLLCGQWRIGFRAQIQRENESIVWLGKQAMGDQRVK